MSAEQPPPPWQIWFDGCAHPNPGRLGLGVVLIGPAGERLESSTLGGSGCNNEAEMLALARALEMARTAGARQLHIRGDSDFAVRHVRGEHITRLPHLKTLIARVQDSLAAFEHARLEWIPRHRNPDADRLSRAALGLPHKPAPRPVARRRR
ncbi:ribonuclease HI family protein [Zoogloea sp.]|uniref:ribonuclease HI family protein n=1 Tax=Zoogloea sp. TaxID=49181 RepID=UPI002617A8BD|nr:ribonuclease HI family protein [Zoogloea sp.]MDD3352918.1 ribonuclease HI family protein [Zoogloea sp.]